LLRKGAVLKSLCPHILIAKSCLSPLQSTNSLSPNSATAELYRKIWHPCYPWIGKSYRTCLEGVQGLNLSPNVMLMWVCVTHHLSSFMFCEVSPILYDFNCHMDRLICFLSIAKIHKLDWVCNRPEEFHPQFSKIYLTSETSIRTLIKTTTPLKWLSLLILPKIFDFKDYSHFFYLLKIWIKLVNSSTYYLYGLSDRMFTGNSGLSGRMFTGNSVVTTVQAKYYSLKFLPSYTISSVTWIVWFVFFNCHNTQTRLSLQQTYEMSNIYKFLNFTNLWTSIHPLLKIRKLLIWLWLILPKKLTITWLFSLPMSPSNINRTYKFR